MLGSSKTHVVVSWFGFSGFEIVLNNNF